MNNSRLTHSILVLIYEKRDLVFPGAVKSWINGLVHRRLAASGQKSRKKFQNHD